jgi:uncharacterized protein
MATLDLVDLDTRYRPPKPVVLQKSIDHIDPHARSFIALSPFCVIASADASHRVDVSPRGGTPGFVHVHDSHTLLMPDRGGNNRLDTLRNLLGGTGQIGMMFIIPGFEDVLRVNGRASVEDDPALAAEFEEFGKLPNTIMRITVEEAFLHCPKAVMRAGLWSDKAKVPRETLPSLAAMVSDQLGLPRPGYTAEQARARAQEEL